MATVKKFDPSKIKGAARLLYEEAALRGISDKPYVLASVLGILPRQLYRWFTGDQPRAKSEEAILAAISKLRQDMPGPEPVQKESGRQGLRSAYRATHPKDPELVREKIRKIRISALYNDLQRHLKPYERDLISTPQDGLTPWEGFVEVLSLIRKRKYKGVFRLPR